MKSALIYFLLITFSLSATAQAKRGSLYVLIIGVSEYANPSSNLTYPAKDAAEVYQLFKKHTTADKIKLLVNQSATHDNILKVGTQLFANTNEEDIVVFYFSGHGNKGVFFAHDESVAYGELKKMFKEVKAGRKVILADACMSGDMRTDRTGKTDPANPVNDQEVCLFLSSRSSQYAVESSGLKNGTFTFFLIAGLRGGADADRNKIITARELFEFVSPKVKQYTDGEQVPVMWGKFEDTMEILNWNKTKK